MIDIKHIKRLSKYLNKKWINTPTYYIDTSVAPVIKIGIISSDGDKPTFFINDNEIECNTNNNLITLSTPSANPYIARIYYDIDNGKFAAEEGSEAAIPSPPNLPDGNFIDCFAIPINVDLSIGDVIDTTGLVNSKNVVIPESVVGSNIPNTIKNVEQLISYFNTKTIFGQQDIGSSNIMVFDNNNTSFYIITQTNQIQKVNRIGFKEGQRVVIILNSGGTIKHNASISGDNMPLLLALENDFTATKKIAIPFIWHDTNGDNIPDVLLEEGGTSIAATVDNQFNLIAKNMQSNAYNLASGGTITGFVINSLTGCTVFNSGSASVTITLNDTITIGNGSIYGVKIYDSNNTLIFEFPCIENNVNVTILHDIINGLAFTLTGVKTIIKQDDYFAAYMYGFDNYTITEDSKIIDVCRKTDGSIIYN